MDEENSIFTVLIADDHDGVRKGIRKIIEKGERFRIVGEARDGKEALRLAQKISPDLLILDVKLPVLRGEEVAKQLRKSNPDVKILVLSSFDNSEYIRGMLENGANGYLTKDEAASLLNIAAKEILENRTSYWISANLKQQTGISFQNSEMPAVTITQTEYKIISMLKKGKSENEIANLLEFSSKRLQRYIRILLLKHEVDSIQELLDLV